MLFIHQKDGNLVICDKMNGSWGHCAKWNKPGREGQIVHGITYTVCEKKS